MVQKTNAARLLDAAGIHDELIPYEVDEEHLDAGHIATGRFFSTLNKIETQLNSQLPS